MDSTGLNALQYCELFNDQETKECILNLEIAFSMVHQIAVPTRTYYCNEVLEVVDLENVNDDTLENISGESTDSGQSWAVFLSFFSSPHLYYQKIKKKFFYFS